jgi:hypothetical protein
MSNAITDDGIYANGRTHAEHCAWLDSLQGDEKQIVHCATGHKYTLVVFSIVKRYLAEEMSSEYRLRFLGYLDKLADAWLTAEAVAMIEPMCDDGYEIVTEARKLGWQKAFDTFAKYEVFSAFVALNPSLMKAIRFCNRGRGYGY